MKKSVFILALLSVITLMSACKKEPSITQGVYGTVIERYGDWMPGANADHGERPIVFVAKTTSNAKGFYEINLAPGTYSIFLLYNGKLTDGGGLDGYGGINPITINSDEKIERQLVLDHAVY